MEITVNKKSLVEQFNRLRGKKTEVPLEEIVMVKYEDYESEDFIPPSSWCIRVATGDYVYFRCRSRAKAQARANELYGEGKYTIRADKKINMR